MNTNVGFLSMLQMRGTLVSIKTATENVLLSFSLRQSQEPYSHPARIKRARACMCVRRYVCMCAHVV